jgi:hypothetical protein
MAVYTKGCAERPPMKWTCEKYAFQISPVYIDDYCIVCAHRACAELHCAALIEA